MNEEKTYEPKKIEIEVGSNINALTIADGIMQFLAERYGHGGFCMNIVEEVRMYEDVRMIGEALLNAYEARERVNEADEKYRR